MEKLGVEKNQLKKELQNEYNTLKEKQTSLSKTSSAAPECKVVETQLQKIKEKISEIDSQD
jgi:hypothetical protein